MKKRYSFLPKYWLCVGLITTVATAFSLNLQAQTAPAKLWDKSIGGNQDDQLISLQQTSAGGYILGGTSHSFISGHKTQGKNGILDYWVVKVDASGNKLWDKDFGGGGYNDLRVIHKTTDGGYILGGSSDAGMTGDKSQVSKGNNDYWIVKIDSMGNKLWDKSYGGNLNDTFTSLYQTSDGGFILGGASTSDISSDKTQACKGGWGSFDYWIVKIDALGNKQWDKTYGGNLHELLQSVQQTSDGGYILGGSTTSSQNGDVSQQSKGGQDYWLIKLDANGNKIWDKVLGGNGDERPMVVQQTHDGGYIFCGASDSNISSDKSQNSKGLRDFWIVKLNASGIKLWDKTIGGSNFDDLTCIQQTSDKGFILGGVSISHASGDKSQPSLGSEDYWIVKIDSLGNKIWDLTLGGDKYDLITTLKSTTDGGLILGGVSKSGLSGNKSQASQGSEDFWVVKLGASPTGLKEPEASFNLSISPNPNQGKFNLQLSNLTAPTAAVTISDLLGRVILQKEIQTTDNQLSEELTLPNAKGMYLLQLKAGEQIITRKIVVE